VGKWGGKIQVVKVKAVETALRAACKNFNLCLHFAHFHYEYYACVWLKLKFQQEEQVKPNL